MNAAKSLRTTTALILLGVLVGCGGGASTGNTGQLNIALTDGPVEKADHVVVAFTGIELKPAGGPALPVVTMNESSCDTFDTSTGTCSIDLLTLTGTNRKVVFSDDLEAGDYQWVRLLVAAERNVMDSYIEFEDGSMCSLWIPSGAETGLKIVSGVTVTANGVSDYTLDFDVRKSVTAPPGMATAPLMCEQNYIMKPAIRIVDTTEVGAVAGTVAESLLAGSESCSMDEFGHYQNAAVYLFEDPDAMAVPDDLDDDPAYPDPVTTASVVWNDDPAVQAYVYEAGYLLAPENYLAALTCTADIDDGAVDDYDPDSADPQDFGFIAGVPVVTEVGATVDGSFLE